MARPVEFNREDVVKKAMAAFWRSGFQATSVTDLVSATQINPGSLYGAFTNKRGLFIEVIEAYASEQLSRITECFHQEISPLSRIASFLHGYCDTLAANEQGHGCLIVNTLLELSDQDPEIQNRIERYHAQIEAELVDSLERARLMGELPEDIRPEDHAKCLMTGLWGLQVFSSKRPCRQEYDVIIESMLSSLGHRLNNA
ncbi:MAG: TetR/AcrR family transcriptional regulator [Pontibacterium sp.]